MLEVRGISKKYVTGDLEQAALDDVSIRFRDNEFVAILGPSGSGKTTLLNIIGGLDRYDSGDLIIDGVSTKEYTDSDWDSYRNHRVGFVFQTYNLIAHQTVLSNVELALTISDVPASERYARATDALRKVGLADQAHKKPNQLSGGQMQRVAIARALVNDPDIILADEPTGALDTKTSIQIMDLLKEVASDRLVIMVTHNPDLADRYATRIINLRDGQITSDSLPVETGDGETTREKTPKTRLSFLTALSLSINNLLTKKGRTFLTAFAGSVGIIGIALILALSHGVNQYIKDMESQLLGTYPVELTRSSLELGSFMSMDDSEDEDGTASDEATTRASGRRSDRTDKQNDDTFSSTDAVASSLQSTEDLLTTNDLKSFKAYLDVHREKLDGNITAVEYSYDIGPRVYRLDKKNGLVQVSPASLSAQDVVGVDYSDLFGEFGSDIGGLSSNWKQLASDPTLRTQQYELVEGKWPSGPGDAALILNERNTVNDYILYTIGLLDISDMNKMIDQIDAGKKITYQEHEFAYKDAIGLQFRAFAPAELYKKSEDVYIDKSEDSKYIKDHLDEGTEMTITCVLRAKEDSGISSGIGYDASLTKKLMDDTANTAVVREQLKNKKVNVLTGKRFTDEQKDSAENNILFSSGMRPTGVEAGEETLAVAPLGMAGTEDLSPVDTALLLPDDFPGSSIVTDVEDFLFRTLTDIFLQLFDELVPKDLVEKLVTRYLDSLTDEQKAELAAQFMGSFTQADLEALIRDYAMNMSEEDINALLEQYLSTIDEKDIQNMIEAYVGSLSEEEIEAMLSSALGSMDQGDLQKMLEEYVMQNQDLIVSSIRDMLTDEELESLVAQFMGTSVNTYEGVLQKLGYQTEDDPSMISIYPSSFEGKDVILKFIEDYNAQVKDTSEKVSYTDYIAAATSSITKIVDTISSVLIAFVAISLVVSSIMIAIITYISVLERTREIGVLRAIGSSKRDISKIFNAETFIEGLMSGLIGVLVTWILCIPIDLVARQAVDIDKVAQLPIQYALILILVSILLTLIAGFIPSRIAAGKDPVAALRSE